MPSSAEVVYDLGSDDELYYTTTQQDDFTGSPMLDTISINKGNMFTAGGGGDGSEPESLNPSNIVIVLKPKEQCFMRKNLKECDIFLCTMMLKALSVPFPTCYG